MEKHYIKNIGETTYVYGVDLEEHKKVIENQQNEIQQLKQQLAEKDKELNENEYISERIIELEELLKYEKEDKNYIIQQLDEKQNTIDEINKEFVQAVHDWKTLCKKKDKEIEKLRKGEYQKCCQHCEIPKQDANDLVIRELKKVKNWCKESWNVSLTLYDEIKDYINQQIKELKGK